MAELRRAELGLPALRRQFPHLEAGGRASPQDPTINMHQLLGDDCGIHSRDIPQ